MDALSQIHPPPLDSNPSKSFWVNGGDVATYKCPRIDLDQKKFPKVQGSIIYLQFYEAFLLPMDLHSQEAIGRPYFLNLTEL